ncbi:class I SAM-dependent methyltransferase [Demequina flava]|uniref:class I SAM-dependent methyltransferase n=1 Tax=Demequina flava TaxID=1095025 RepID=UPI0007857796|nr:methyltransferase domain-containing protein [Demequina flava]
MSDRFSYGGGARYYDQFSGEWLYRAGRVEGVQMLGARAGDTVLDVGCGTGKNFPLLLEAVGPTGHVLGLDRSPQMLDVARARVDRHLWPNVTLVQADATRFTAADLKGRTPDAVLSTYAMSVTDDPDAVWQCVRAVTYPGSRVCIVDMRAPTGLARLLEPLARLACAMGGADINAHPWTLLEADGAGVEVRGLRGGHIQVGAGTRGRSAADTSSALRTPHSGPAIHD